MTGLLSSGTKVSKSAAHYGPGMPSAHCSICRHWLGGGRCDKVAGTVAPDGWCRFFRRKAG